MPWESAVIGLLADALKSILGRIMDSRQERQAAQLISEATRELLLVHPHIEEVRANLIKADKLLKTPSPQLLHAQYFLDVVLRNNQSAQDTIRKIQEFHHLEGNVQGFAQTNLLLVETLLEDGNRTVASQAFYDAVGLFENIGEWKNILKILPKTIKAYVSYGATDDAQHLLKEVLHKLIKIALWDTPHNLQNQVSILNTLGKAANACDLKLMALRVFAISYSISISMPEATQQSDELRSQILKNSKALSFFNVYDQFNEVIYEAKDVWQARNVDEIVSYLDSQDIW